ncbi:MAG: sulfur carrier protein ThiS [Anaerovoracaceae bacterium]
MDIRIIVNNKEMAVPEGTAVTGLLDLAGYNRRVAIWINGSQLLGSEYDTRCLEEDDVVKILRLVAGG